MAVLATIIIIKLWLYTPIDETESCNNNDMPETKVKMRYAPRPWVYVAIILYAHHLTLGHLLYAMCVAEDMNWY